MQKTYSGNYCTQMHDLAVVADGEASCSPRTADRVERYVQETWTESMFGEDGGNVGST